MSKFLTMNENKLGKDYICSDIHGHFYLLEKQLKRVQFNTERDRLFCLGDLIDRSYDSPLVLDYLAKPWFYSILGNHELMLIDVCESEDPSMKQQWYFWGGYWAEDLSDEELNVYYQSFNKLPIALELKIGSGIKVGLIHANLPAKSDWNEVKIYLQDDKRGYNSYDPLFRDMLWNKAQVLGENIKSIKPVSQIDHVFHGHTILEDIVVIENRTYMDLGSYDTQKLGFIQVNDYLAQV